jgi:uncharacterized membrane protein
MRRSTLELTTLGLFGAIILVMAFVPQVGFITFGIVALTIIHIPVLIGGFFGGKKVTLGLALIFGIASMLQAIIRPVSIVDVLFQNPLVSVLPRFLFGLSIVYLSLGFKKLFENPYLIAMSTFAISTFLHTVFVLSSVYVFSPFFTTLNNFAQDTPFWPLITSVMAANGVFEIVAAIFIAAPIAVRISAANPFSEA